MLYLLRHAHTRINPERPTSGWVLSEQGHQQAKTVRDTIGLVFDRIYSSEEKKAVQTAEFFLHLPQAQIRRSPLLNELNRDQTPYLSSENYYDAVETALTNPSLKVHEWETAENAHSRFLQGLKRINMQNSNALLLVVSHGLVLSLFFSKALDQLDAVYERWKRLQFCGWGIIEDECITKDIIA